MIRKTFQRTLNQALKQYNFSSSPSVTIDLAEYDTHKLDSYDSIPTSSTITKDELLRIFESMTLMRKMEYSSDELYKEKFIKGFCHLYDGQEAVIEGIETALNWDDMMITAYRCHCNALKRGVSVHEIIAEMMGKRTGSSQGKGGSMHFYNNKNNFYGGNGIVGAQIPVGAGLAFGLKFQGKPNVAVSMYGDGAANQGQLFEAANMSYLWNLPMLFVCENNKYAMGTSVARHAMNTKFYTRGDMIPGIRMDGNNFFHVYEGFKWAKQYAIKNGPLFIELDSYRYHGHSMSDPGVSYRSRDEISEHKKTRDCLLYIKNIILDNDFATQKELKAIQKKCNQIVNEAVKKAKADPFPTVEEDLYTDVYKNNDEHFMRGVEYETSFWGKTQPHLHE